MNPKLFHTTAVHGYSQLAIPSAEEEHESTRLGFGRQKHGERFCFDLLCECVHDRGWEGGLGGKVFAGFYTP